MGNIFNFLDRAADMKPLSNIMVSVAVILALWLVRNIVVRIIIRRTEDVRTRYVWNKALTYIATLAGIINWPMWPTCISLCGDLTGDCLLRLNRQI